MVVPSVDRRLFLLQHALDVLQRGKVVERMDVAGDQGCAGAHLGALEVSTAAAAAKAKEEGAARGLAEAAAQAARSAAGVIKSQIVDRPRLPTVPAWDESQVTDADEEVVVAHNWDELRRFMWDYVGIVRTTKRLERARRRVHLLRNEIGEFYANFRVTSDLIELRNLVQVAELVIRCALKRKESRGLHFTLDHPAVDDRNYQRDTILRAGDFG